MYLLAPQRGRAFAAFERKKRQMPVEGGGHV